MPRAEPTGGFGRFGELDQAAPIVTGQMVSREEQSPAPAGAGRHAVIRALPTQASTPHVAGQPPSTGLVAAFAVAGALERSTACLSEVPRTGRIHRCVASVGVETVNQAAQEAGEGGFGGEWASGGGEGFGEFRVSAVGGDSGEVAGLGCDLVRGL